MSHSFFRLGSCLLVMSLIAGCGGDGVTVSGTVTYNGQPVEKGSISFQPADGKGNSAGGDITAGKFSVKNVAPGKNKVLVASQSSRPGSTSMDDSLKKTKPAPPDDIVPPDAVGNNQVVDVASGTPLELSLKAPSRNIALPKGNVPLPKR